MRKKIIGIAKDITVAGVIVGVIIGILVAYTGVWPPLVVIETGSMTHEDAGFGKLGTIDPGDFVLVKKAPDKEDIVTYYEGKAKGYRTYGDYGDVLIYVKNGAGGTPVIHRAMCWVEVNGSNYDIPGLKLYNLSSITVETEELNLRNYKPRNSGFLTKGDDNTQCDQDPDSNIADAKGRKVQPVKPEWTQGKAVGELPWFGLIKLSVDDSLHGTRNAGNAPPDCWVMLGVSIALIIGVSTSVDLLSGRIKKKGLRARLKRFTEQVKSKFLE